MGCQPLCPENTEPWFAHPGSDKNSPTDKHSREDAKDAEGSRQKWEALGTEEFSTQRKDEVPRL